MARRKPDHFLPVAEPVRETGREVVDRMNALAISAFGLIAALAWNSAIQALFDKYFPIEKGEGIIAKLLYALFVTITVVIVTLWLSKLSRKNE